MKRDSGLSARYHFSAETAEKGGGRDPFKFPSGTKFFSPAEGRNRIRIVPYTVKSEEHPLVVRAMTKVGKLDYVMDVYVHKMIGIDNESVLCLKKNFGKFCPICEKVAKLRAEGKEKEYGALKAQRRVYYNVLDLDNLKEGVQVFSVSHYLFERRLIAEASYEAQNRGEEIVDFADPDEGCIVEFRGERKKMGANSYMDFESFRFRKDDEPLSKEDLKDALNFDEIMIVRSADEMEQLLSGSERDEYNDYYEDRDVEEEERESSTRRGYRKDDVEEREGRSSRKWESREDVEDEDEDSRKRARGRRNREDDDPDEDADLRDLQFR